VTEKELGESLLKWDAYGNPADPRMVTLAVLARDRRSVRWATVVTVLFWLLAIGAVVGMVIFFHVQLEPRLQLYVRTVEARDIGAWVMVARLAADAVLATAVLLLLAALSTVALVFTSRRATLRQVNANLAAIAEELRQLRKSAGAVHSQHGLPGPS
jgi:hypothetical protein